MGTLLLEFFKGSPSTQPWFLRPDSLVTFQVDMREELSDVAPGSIIGLRGNPAPLDWAASIPMDDADGDSIYTATVDFGAVASGTEFAYKFVHHLPGADSADVVWEDSVGAGAPPYYGRVYTYGGVGETLPVDVWTGMGAGALQATLSALLQGGWTGSTMRTTLVGAAAFPTTQPYNTAPWNYTGTETNATPPSTTTDWVLVQLRTDTASATAVASVAALVLEDGSIVDASGSGPVQIAVDPGSYYVVLYHRNHVPVITANPVDFSSGAASYDFTTGAGQALGSNSMVPLGAGGTPPFALWAGDGNVDGLVTAPDFNLYSAATAAGATGYEVADYNLDALVSAPDFNLYSPNTAVGPTSGVPGLLQPDGE